MSIHLSQVYEYLDANPISQHSGDFASLLEMIHYIYTDCNPIDNGVIRAALAKFECLTEKLTLSECDELFDVISGLCWEHESIAFYHGIHVGLSLMTELHTLP